MIDDMANKQQTKEIKAKLAEKRAARKRRKPYTEEEARRVVELYSKPGATCRSVAAATGVSEVTVSRMVRRFEQSE